MGKKRKNRWKFGVLVFALFFIVATYLFIDYYQKIYASASSVNDKNQYLYVKSSWKRKDLVQHLLSQRIISDTASFLWVADQKKFFSVKPGRYLLTDGMSNNSMVNLLRSGKQEPVQLTFNSIRKASDLAGKVAKQIEADSLALVSRFQSEEVARKYGFSSTTFITMFIPNTYEFYWDTSVDEFIKRMAKEYKRFWSVERKKKARNLGLSQSEVAILASLVQAEQMQHPEERPRVAGLYLNRLKSGMLLQSDPTLIYALGDFSIRRVLNQHKKLSSKYNTYLYAGLPPGPINLPEVSSLEAVLNYEKHDYLYMCAKPDFSGYHNFARTLSKHNVYAEAYRRELNRRNIMQ